MVKEFKIDFIKRAKTSLLLALVILAVFLIENFWLFSLFIFLVSFLSLKEWLSNDSNNNGWFYNSWLLNLKGPLGHMTRLIIFLTLFLIPLAHPFSKAFLFLFCIFLTFWICLTSISILHKDSIDKEKITFSNHTFGFFLILNFYWISILFIGNSEQLMSPYIIFLFILLNTAIFDIFAYLVGSKIGQNYIFSTISPKKTLEGLLGGFFGVILFSTLLTGYLDYFYFGEASNFIYLTILISIIGGFFAFTGDLMISHLKRKAGIKDTGDILPGHGGILDRVDSHLIAAPALIILIAFASSQL